MSSQYKFKLSGGELYSVVNNIVVGPVARAARIVDRSVKAKEYKVGDVIVFPESATKMIEVAGENHLIVEGDKVFGLLIDTSSQAVGEPLKVKETK